MLKTLCFLFYLLLLASFLLPESTYACGMDAKKSCCQKEIGTKSAQKECCKKSNSKDKNNSCGGKCGHSNCTTTGINFSIITFNEIDFKNSYFNFLVTKSIFYHSETFTSDGFTSVWLPPKI